MVAIMHIKLTDNAPGRMLDLFDIGIDGHRTLGDDGSDELAGRSPAAEPKNRPLLRSSSGSLAIFAAIRCGLIATANTRVPLQRDYQHFRANGSKDKAALTQN